MTLREKLVRYAELLHGSLENLSLPPGASIAGKRTQLYQHRRFTRQIAERADNSSELKQTANSHLDETERATACHCFEEHELLTDLIRPPPKRLCILGEAGMGKSTFLEQVAWRFAEQLRGHASGHEQRVPVFVRLKAWERVCSQNHSNTPPKERLWRLIHSEVNHLAEHNTKLLSERELARLCHSGAPIILMDGLDDISTTKDRVELIRALTLSISSGGFLCRCSILLSSRPEVLHALDLGGCFRIARCNLEPLEDLGAVERYLASYFSNQRQHVEKLIAWVQSTSPELQHFLRRPLFLSLLCATNETGDLRLAAAPADLLKSSMRFVYVSRMHEHIEAGLELLGELAELFIEHGVIDRSDAVKTALRVCKTNELIRTAFGRRKMEPLLNRLATRSGLLTSVRGGYGFSRQVYADYMAGRNLANKAKAEPLGFLQVVCQRAWRPEWQAALGWMAAELWHTDRPFARQLVEWVLAHIDDARDDLRGSLAMLSCRLLSGSNCLSRPGEEALGQRVADFAWLAWRWANIALNSQAVAAASMELAMLPVSAKEHLLPRILDDIAAYRSAPRPFLQFLGTRLCNTVDLVGQLCVASEDVVRSLVSILSDRTPQWISSATAALKKLAAGSREFPWSSLITMLESPDEYRHWRYVAAVLRYHKDARASAWAVLARMLNSQTPHGLRLCAAEASIELGMVSNDVIVTLVGILTDPEANESWESAASELKRLGSVSQDAIAALIRVVESDKAIGVRADAVYALAKYGVSTEEVVSALADMIHNRSSQGARIAGARGLKILNATSDEAVADLIEMAQEPRIGYRAIEALGIPGPGQKNAVSALRTMLKSSPYIRETAEALQARNAVCDEMISIVVDRATAPGWNKNRLEAISTLGQWGVARHDVIVALMHALKESPDELERVTAAQVLCDFGVVSDEAGLAMEHFLMNTEMHAQWHHMAKVLRVSGAAVNPTLRYFIDVLNDPAQQPLWKDAALAIETIGITSEQASAEVASILKQARGEVKGLLYDALTHALLSYGGETIPRQLAGLGDLALTARACEKTGLTLFHDMRLETRRHLMLDLRLYPGVVEGGIDKETREVGKCHPPKEVALMGHPFQQSVASLPSSIFPTILEFLELPAPLVDWERMGARQREAEWRMQQYCFVEHLAEFRLFASQAKAAEEAKGEYDLEAARRLFGRNVLERKLKLKRATLSNTWTWRVALAACLKLGRKSKGSRAHFDAVIATTGIPSETEVTFLAQEMQERIQKALTAHKISSSHAQALTLELGRAQTPEDVNRIEKILDALHGPGGGH